MYKHHEDSIRLQARLDVTEAWIRFHLADSACLGGVRVYELADGVRPELETVQPQLEVSHTTRPTSAMGTFRATLGL